MRGSWSLLLVLPLAACGVEVDAGDAPVFQPLAAQPPAPHASGAETSAPQPSAAAADAVPAISALLYSDLDAEVAPRIDGVVRAVHVELGDAVRAGQVLAVLDDGREAARVASARAALELAQTEHDRGLALRDRDLIPHAEYETLKYRLRAGEAALREAGVELAYTRITAPFTGVVTRRVTSVGRTAVEGEPLFRVTALRPLRLLLRLPESQAYAVPIGADVHIAGTGGAVAEGRVVRVSPAVDAGSGTAEVLVDVPRPGSLRPGSEVLVSLKPTPARARP